jgi:sporulation protein YlmC with PRC-barrel domain
MYSLASNLVDQPIISLQTGQVVAWVAPPVLNLSNLEVVAFTCIVPRQKEALLLLAGDIRQYATDCIIIDDEDELTSPDDLVRFTTDLNHNYSPLGKPVIADTGRKLGVVEDYSINLETNRVQKLYVKQSIWRALLGSNLIIDRTQIIDITPKQITVRDATVTEKQLASDVVPEFHP